MPKTDCRPARGRPPGSQSSAGTLAGLAALMLCSPQAASAEATRSSFGVLPDGTPVEAVTLSAGSISATIITLGASLQALRAPDRAGHVEDVVLGYDDLTGYLAKPNFFGATIGRVGNRIAHGRYTLDGKVYHAPLNDGPNSLHGGDKGFDKANWRILALRDDATPSVTLAYTSTDGEEGYPGTVQATATYSLNARGELAITYRATTDRPTLLNMTNHTYWNLAGEGAARGAMGEVLTIPAETYTPVDATLIPTGEIRSVAGTPFDFRRPTAIDARLRDGQDSQLRYGRGYDHNWVISRNRTAAPQLMARLSDPVSGRILEVLSNQPGVQVYSGNFLDGTIAGKRGHLYRAGDAVAMEPQMFPDTPNHPEFGSIRVAPGEVYENLIIFRLQSDHGAVVK